jgi:hypothetical protein
VRVRVRCVRVTCDLQAVDLHNRFFRTHRFLWVGDGREEGGDLWDVMQTVVELTEGLIGRPVVGMMDCT